MNLNELKECQLAIHDLIEHDDFDNAIPLIYAVLENYPDDAPTIHFLGYIWLLSGKEALAYQMFKRAVELQPNNKALWTSLGRAYHEMDRPLEAINCFVKSAELDPNYTMAYSNMSATLVQLSDWSGAEKASTMALECSPTDLNAQLNLAHCYLAKGEWDKGWAEWNKSLGGKFRKEYVYGDEPRWNGSAEKNLVIYGEQGLGDEIFYASCINDALEISNKVYIDCDAKLEGLFKRSFPQAEVHGTRKVDNPKWLENVIIDARCSIGSLPEFFRHDDSDFNGNAYLKADPERRLMWRALFDSYGKRVIGITTHGGRKMTNAKGRKLTDRDLKPLLKQDFVFVSLDYNVEERIEGVKYFEWATNSDDYDDTAALIAELDGVVGINTTALHCAGALGVPTWALVPKCHQWRYARPTMLWYKSMNMVKQGERGWIEVVANVWRDVVKALC